MELTYGSICSGIEAVSVAWKGLGFVPVWFSEIEPFPCAVLKHHYPAVPNYGDMTTLPERILSSEVEAPDILVGGTPCQAFSVAGLRKSLSDERGNLTIVFVRILNAINTIRRHYGLPDAVALWENVPGILSTRDNAFGCFLAALLGESKEIVSTRRRWTSAGVVRTDEREIAWRTLDAQYFGVPQRRKRVFLIAGNRNHCPAEILFERQGEDRDFKTSREARENTSAFTESSFGTYKESYIGGTIKRKGGTAQGGSETLLVSSVDKMQARNFKTVRRLTPRECERLQGFPDDYTKIPWNNKLAEYCPDTPRYMALGNSMAVPVIQWIGQRLKDKQTAL